ncbi:MAG: ZIP family metal transporter [Candidatus Nomurabacteria bacterium]|jgi:zinc and cadmium transporter|nr:ZIP family metal transporter [Candidatus Nomurabacteria bacterium]
MPVILQVVICSLVGGLFSIAGGVALAMSKKHAKYASYATSFAAGALIAAAFMDLLPEAVEEGDPHQIMLFTMVGLVFFFLLEGMIHWFHRHPSGESASSKPINSMIIIGDTIHNFIDGTAIAAGFLISPISGLIVTLAVVAHEIPQEIGDFGVMLHNGVSRGKAILINALSACASTAGAVIFYLLGDAADINLAPLLGVVAGFFIYIAATDIIPTIHRERTKAEAVKKSAWVVVGVVLISLVIVNLHSIAHEYSEGEHEHETSECDEHHHDE